MAENNGIDYTHNVRQADLRDSVSKFVDEIAKTNNVIDLDAVYGGALGFVQTHGAREYWISVLKSEDKLKQN